MLALGWGFLVCFAVSGMANAAEGATGIASEDLTFFEAKVRPVLVERCYECHSVEGGKRKGGLLLDHLAGWSVGGDTGSAIVPGDVEQSLVSRAISYKDPDFEMPPTGKLPQQEIDVLNDWIQRGAPDPRVDVTEALADGAQAEEKGYDWEKEKEFWAFQKPVWPEVPEVKNRNWVWTELDAFVLSKLEEQELDLAPDVDASTLARRLSFDLVGLPPQEQWTQELDGTRAGWERYVDTLLASPHFGEKWGRHWLDLARFAESTGGGRSSLLPNAWRYRNYVMDSFNRDKPLNEFISEQIAGDLMPADSKDQRAERLIATAYLSLGPKNLDLQDKELLQMNTVDEQIDTLGRSLMGMTISCARCHDHKFDPIPVEDYYGMAGILLSTKSLVRGNISSLLERELPVDPEVKEAVRKHEKIEKEMANRVIALRKEVKEAEDETTRSELSAELKEREAELKAHRASAPVVPNAIAVDEMGQAEDCHVRIRGNPHQKGDLAPRGFLTIASTAGSEERSVPKDQSGRMELAQWLTDPDHPLVTRVYVNRIWKHMTGRGLVRTVDNFGNSGEKPTHPELLDYLALDFQRMGWSTKALIRKIAMSHFYQLSSEAVESSKKKDPENLWRWRMNQRRLEAEALRDSILVVSGELDPSVSEKNLGTKALSESRLRSVYLPVFREEGMNDLFEVFDFANPSFTVGSRPVSSTPTQSLFLMNSPFVQDQALKAAELALKERPDLNVEEQIENAFQRCLHRDPTAMELGIAREYLGEDETDVVGKAALAGLYHALLAGLDFRFVR